jgi:hypothetical protein
MFSVSYRPSKAQSCHTLSQKNTGGSEYPAPLAGEFEHVIMIVVGDRRNGWAGLSS